MLIYEVLHACDARFPTIRRVDYMMAFVSIHMTLLAPGAASFISHVAMFLVDHFIASAAEESAIDITENLVTLSDTFEAFEANSAVFFFVSYDVLWLIVKD